MAVTSKSLSLALAAAFAIVALPVHAAHMTQYANNPVEHDDQGRVNEPDGARSSLYDAGVADCTIDRDDDGRCTAADLAAWPQDMLIAPGCTDSLGRRPSGLCGLQTLHGLPSITTPAGCNLPYGEQRHRMLDLRYALYPTTGVVGGHPIFEVNRKLQDLGADQAERSLGGSGGDRLLGGTAVLAWYGLFLDKNCNGVIDQWGGEESDPRNEFTWIGTCQSLSGQVVVPPDVCQVEPTDLVGWALPGAHHAHLGKGALCSSVCLFVPADYPGSLAVCELGNRLPADPFAFGSEDCEAEEDRLRGDPLLGTGNGQAPDFWFYGGYTGDPDLNTRTYVAASNWPMYHYDTGLLTTTVMIGAVNPPIVEEGLVYEVEDADFLDVDRFVTRSPHLEGYLNGVVKPTARSTWLLVRGHL